MIFSSIGFIFHFLPAFLLIYFITPKSMRQLCIFAFSLLFYAVGVAERPEQFLLLALSLIVNFRIARLLGKRRFFLILGIGFNIGLLLYAKLFLSLLPLGISFYTFQSISYLVDTWRSGCAERSFLRFGANMTFFPKLISGPLIRYASLRTPRVTRRGIAQGAELFVLGLGYKVLLANRLSGLWKDINTIGFDSISTPLAWIGILAYSLQIYFDFWGYSMMAQGLGRLVGFRLPRNFDHPYASLTMSEFWRRWHMTLGTWFRDYVYIPLGGNRIGTLRTYGNLLLVWLLTAFWHGTDLHFLLWGLFIFLLIASEKAGLSKFWNAHSLAAHLYIAFAIGFSWLLFAVEDTGTLSVYIGRLLGLGGENIFAGDFKKYVLRYGIFLLTGLLFSTKLPTKLYAKAAYRPPLRYSILTVIFLTSLYCILMQQNDPFLYFNF